MLPLQQEQSDSPGRRAALIFRTNALLLDRKMARLGLCSGQVPYIIALARREGWTQDELSVSVRVNRAATARTLKAMERSGLVTRRVNPENKRQKLVSPTNKAKAMVPELLEILNAHHEHMLAGFSTKDKRLLLTLMDRVIDNIEAMLHQGEDDHELSC